MLRCRGGEQLDANENLHPVPEELMAAVNGALASLSSGCSAQIYPDPTQVSVRSGAAGSILAALSGQMGCSRHVH